MTIRGDSLHKISDNHGITAATFATHNSFYSAEMQRYLVVVTYDISEVFNTSAHNKSIYNGYINFTLSASNGAIKWSVVILSLFGG